jgi:hypothetical protein
MSEWDSEWGEEPEEYEDPVRSTVTRTVALILIVALAVGFAGVNLLTALRSDDAITAKEALADDRGFRFLALDPRTDAPVRYDPCSPLHYVVNPANAPFQGLKDIEGAIALTAEATGIEFVFDGITDEPVTGNRELFQPERYGDRWPPLLIGWMAHDSAIFDIEDVGVAGSAIEENADGRLMYVTGSVALNGSEHLANGFAPGKTWGKVVLHELGHVLGLGHVDDPGQVMHDSLVSSPALWGAGDLAGLRELGRPAGCLDPPPAP